MSEKEKEEKVISLFLSFYNIKTTICLPETFSKLIQRARIEYSFKENNINEGLLIYTYQVDSLLYGISSETEYIEFKNYFNQDKVHLILIQEKQANTDSYNGISTVCQTDSINPEVYEDYMKKVIQREIELAGERIRNYLLKEHVMSSHFHDHGIDCVECKKNIIGFLYKCTICDEANFCEGCMDKIIEHKHPCFKIR